MTLDELRKEIDGVDTELLQLFARRMHLVEEIGLHKKSEGLPVFQPGREKEILTRTVGLLPPHLQYYGASFCKYLIELSRTRQREVLSGEAPPDNVVSVLIRDKKPELKNPRVTVQGIPGSFSMSAALSMYPQGKMSYVSSWEDVLYAVEDGSCDYGVLPVENSSAGSVNEVYDLLIKYKHYIVKALPLSVEQCLLGVRGAKLSDFLRKNHRMQRFPSVNTAVAAEFVAREGKIENAAIASKDCAHIYGLDVLACPIQQSCSNTTRFISVSKRPEIADNANKISLFFALPHTTGSLYRTLARFALNGLNLTKIESRPNPQKNFEYYFYLDFTGSVKSEATRMLLTSLSEEMPAFCFLGNYCEP